MTLYEIDAAILDCIDTETGEIVDADKLNALQMAREEKVEAVALWIKDLTAEAAALKAEKQAFAERQAAAEKKAESLRKWLSDALAGQKFKTTRVAVSFRKTESVDVPDVWALGDEYLKFADPTPDKQKIKAALKAGEAVTGAALVEGQSMTIK